MNLQQLQTPKTSQEYANQYKHQFGKEIKLDMTFDQAVAILSETKQLLDDYRKSNKFFDSHKDGAYNRTLMIEQALTAKVKELKEADSFGGNNKQAGKTMKQIVPGKTYANALKKTAMGEDITDKEWAKLKEQGISKNLLTVLESKKASVKLMKKIVESKRVLKEDEVENAQIVLAAQDMVDRIQKMIEDMVDLQYKDVPALADTMSREMGLDQANTFKTQMDSALGSLADQLNSSKTEMQTAVAVVTGEEMPSEMGELEGVDAEPEMDVEPEVDANMDMDIDAEVPMDDMDVEELGDIEEPELGRERR